MYELLHNVLDWWRIQNFGDSIIEELDAIDYWKDFPDRHKDNTVVEFIDIVDVPQQEYITN